MQRTFAEWMAEVNRIIDAKLGVSADDLPDFCWQDAYDCGDSPSRAVHRCLTDED